ncbi:MAG: FAD-dependent oxidoreductase [Propionibacteriaceae bacterium]|jgi:dihydrolipoamide dehydrogenase|nr:FAD-dependent oxidoreductase [Propionibacteriaceae bacterium]
MAEHDVIIVGGGPGGYIAAQRLAERKLSVLLAEPRSLGGTCFAGGCVATHSLLHGAGLYRAARAAGPLGVDARDVTYSWAQMRAHQQETVRTLVGGIGATLRRLGVTVVEEPARVLGAGEVEVGGERHEAEDIIIATGSVPSVPPIPGAIGNPHVVQPAGLVAVAEPPGRLTVLGADAVGLQMAQLFAALGSTVTLVETLDEILPTMDADLAATYRSSLQGVDCRVGRRVESIDGGAVNLSASGRAERVDADLVVMSFGRLPRFEGWGADRLDIDITPHGVTVDSCLRTNLPGVWAVGDVTGESSYAHGAYRMGEVVAALITDPAALERGQRMRWDAIPYTVAGWAEAAGVGLTEEECRRRGLDVVTATVPLVLTSRFVIDHGLSPAGAVKVIAERATKVICGIHIFGPHAAEAIWGAAAVVEMELTVAELRQVVFPHPTIAEGIREACWTIRD